MSKKKIEAYKAQIPDLLNYFSAFLKTKNLIIEKFQYDEKECDQIEAIMRAYFRGKETEYFVFDDYIASIRTIGHRPAIGKKDINYDSFAVYIGEFVIHNTPCDGYELGRKRSVLEGEITWKFINMGHCSINPESFIITRSTKLIASLWFL